MTGSVVTPVVLCANIKRHKDGTGLGRKEPRPGCSESEIDSVLRPGSSEVRPLIPHHDRHQLYHSVRNSRSASAIPIAVLLGFVVPSIVLIACPSPLVAGLWNFFPIAIYAVHALALILLGEDRQSPFYAERDVGSVARIYAIPVALSILAHIYFIACWIWAKGGAQDEWGPTRKLMLINFWTIVTTYVYWL